MQPERAERAQDVDGALSEYDSALRKWQALADAFGAAHDAGFVTRSWPDIETFGWWVQVGENPEARRLWSWDILQKTYPVEVADWVNAVVERSRPTPWDADD